MKMNKQILAEVYETVNQYIIDKYSQARTLATDEQIANHYYEVLLMIQGHYNLSNRNMCKYVEAAKRLWIADNGDI